MQDLKLSFCIPTHQGRRPFVKELIDSILAQVVGRHEGVVEICVSDNGTTDGTEEILSEYKAKYPNIFTINRFDHDVDGKINILKSVEIAHGEFCWLVGSDDRLGPGGLEAMLDVLDRNSDITGLFCRWRNFTFDMQYEISDWTQRVAPYWGVVEYTFTSLNQAATYTGAIFGNFSCQVFRRSAWNDVVESEGFDKVFSFGHAIILYIDAKMIEKSPKWLMYCGYPIHHRDHNSGAIDLLQLNIARYMIDVSTDVFRAWKAVIPFGTPTHKAVVRQWFKAWYSKGALGAYKLQPSHNSKDDIDLLKCYYEVHKNLPEFYKLALPSLLVPHSFVKASKRFVDGLDMRGRIRSVTMMLAPRTRLRRVFKMIGVENSWTKHYDIEVEHRMFLAKQAERDELLQKAFRASVQNMLCRADRDDAEVGNQELQDGKTASDGVAH